MKPTTSIIIPCYNAESCVGAAIESALGQTYADVEVIVIDDGSTDGSRDVIRSFGERVRWERQSNQGAPAARNRGLELARGAYVKFLDADDVLMPDCIEQQVRQAEALPADQRAIVYGDAVWMDANGNRLTHSFSSPRPRRAGEDPIAHILTQNPLTSCPLHHKAYLREVGGFDERLSRGQEHDLHLRLVLSGVAFVHRAGPVYQHRQHDTGGRISDQAYSQRHPLEGYETIQHHWQLIRERTGQPLSRPVRVALARRLWAYGRGVLREGHPEAAGRYFETARHLDSKRCVTGRFPYPALETLFGPRRAEQAMNALKSARRSLPAFTRGR